MVFRLGPNDKLVRIGADGELGFGHNAGQHGLRFQRADRFDLVGLQFQSCLQRRLALELVDERFDFLMIGLGAPGDQLGSVRGAVAERHAWKRFAKDVPGTDGTGRFQVVDHDLRARVAGLLDHLVDGRLDRQVIGGSCPGHQAAGAGIDRHLGVGDGGPQKRRGGCGVELLDGVDYQRGSVLGVWILQLVDDVLHFFVIGGRSEGDQLGAVAPAVVELHVWECSCQHVVGSDGSCVSQIVDHDFRCAVASLTDHLVDRGLDHQVIGGRCPGHQVARVRVDRDSGVGHDGAHEG